MSRIWADFCLVVPKAEAALLALFRSNILHNA